MSRTIMLTSQQIADVIYYYEGHDDENEDITDALKHRTSMTVLQIAELSDFLTSIQFSFTNADEELIADGDEDELDQERRQNSIDDTRKTLDKVISNFGGFLNLEFKISENSIRQNNQIEQEYCVHITEVQKGYVSVNADSFKQAKEKADKCYKDGKVTWTYGKIEKMSAKSTMCIASLLDENQHNDIVRILENALTIIPKDVFKSVSDELQILTDEIRENKLSEHKVKEHEQFYPQIRNRGR